MTPYGRACGQMSASRETDYPDFIRIDFPCGRIFSDSSDGLLGVEKGNHAPPFWQAILEDDAGDSIGI